MTFKDFGSQLKVVINDDGTLTLDARGMVGSEAELKDELEALARELGGELVVEKHIEKGHGHHSHKRHENIRSR